MLNETSIQEFKSTLRGGIIEPQKQGYVDTRNVYYATVQTTKS